MSSSISRLYRVDSVQDHVSRKRSASPASPRRPTTKRLLETEITAETIPSYSRANSPTKSLQWQPKLVQGPSGNGSWQRSATPSRPALHSREIQNGGRGPSAQLQQEQEDGEVIAYARTNGAGKSVYLMTMDYSIDNHFSAKPEKKPEESDCQWQTCSKSSKDRIARAKSCDTVALRHARRSRRLHTRRARRR